MPIHALFPFAGNHAVQSVAFSVEWAGTLTEVDIVKIKELHREKLAQAFPTVAEPQLVVFNIEAGGPPQISSPSKASAVTFSKPNQVPSLGVVRTIQVLQDRLIVAINDYSRWSSTWSQIQLIVSCFAPQLLAQRPLVAAGLQYNDIFLWRDAPANLNLREVFSENTEYLPSHIFAIPGLWHSHHGYFEGSSGSVAHSLLTNVNVALVESDGQRSISITTSHRATLDTPLWQADPGIAALYELFPGMHQKNKDILRNLLTDEVRRKINLQD